MAALREVWANYRDESFILQYLSPRLIRQFGLFHVMDDASEPNLRVQSIHDERGYRKIQRALARQYDVAWNTPDIQVVDVNLAGDRRLIVHHRALNRVLLEERDARLVLQHLADLWGYDVLLQGDRSRHRRRAEGACGDAARGDRPTRVAVSRPRLLLCQMQRAPVFPPGPHATIRSMRN